MKNVFNLDPNTKLKLVATHKETLQEFTKTITFYEWQKLIKNKNYYYKVYEK